MKPRDFRVLPPIAEDKYMLKTRPIGHDWEADVKPLVNEPVAMRIMEALNARQMLSEECWCGDNADVVEVIDVVLRGRHKDEICEI